jgi:hypothetical protein
MWLQTWRYVWKNIAGQKTVFFIVTAVRTERLEKG